VAIRRVQERLCLSERQPVSRAHASVFALCPHAMPAANSGASSPLSIAAAPSVRMADTIGDGTPVQGQGLHSPRVRRFLRVRQHGADDPDTLDAMMQSVMPLWLLMKWSYTIYRSDEDLDGIQRGLDEMGLDGWELVSVTHQSLVDENEQAFDQYTLFFKRPAE